MIELFLVQNSLKKKLYYLQKVNRSFMYFQGSLQLKQANIRFLEEIKLFQFSCQEKETTVTQITICMFFFCVPVKPADTLWKCWSQSIPLNWMMLLKRSLMPWKSNHVSTDHSIPTKSTWNYNKSKNNCRHLYLSSNRS